MPGRTTGELAFLNQYNIVPAFFRKMIEEIYTQGPPADHNDSRLRW